VQQQAARTEPILAMCTGILCGLLVMPVMSIVAVLVRSVTLVTKNIIAAAATAAAAASAARHSSGNSSMSTVKLLACLL
jgi:hypothetical protein